jgi:hypothetical protein
MIDLVVTTSWDGGHPLDSVLADLLRGHGLTATFYVAPRRYGTQLGYRRQTASLRELAEDFEIGSGTLTNQLLTRTSDREAETEILDSRTLLEDLLGIPVETFRYPGGVFEARHVQMVARAGYRYARTTRQLVTTRPTDPLQAATTLASRRFSLRHRLPGLVGAARAIGSFSAVRTGNWDDIAIALFDRCLVTGGVFHLWGRSSLLSQRSEANRLERVFQHLARRPGARYVVTSELGLPANPQSGEARSAAAASGDSLRRSRP